MYPTEYIIFSLYKSMNEAFLIGMFIIVFWTWPIGVCIETKKNDGLKLIERYEAVSSGSDMVAAYLYFRIIILPLIIIFFRFSYLCTLLHLS